MRKVSQPAYFGYAEPPSKTTKKVFAICAFDSKRIALNVSKSKEHKSDVLKLLQVKHDPATHGKFNRKEMRGIVLRKFFGEEFDENKVLGESEFSVKKGTDFVVMYVNLANVPGGINGCASYRHISDLDRPYKPLPIPGGAKALLLPSVVAAIRKIPEFMKK